MSAPWPKSFPSEDANFGALHVGNTKDDDAQIIDQDFLEVDDAPTPPTEPIPVTKLKDTIKRHTRLHPVTMNIDPAWTGATMVLPANPDRVGLQLRVTSPTAVTTDYLGIASDPGELQNSSNLQGRLYHSQTVSLDYHTGAVWASALGSSAVVGITVWESSK